MIGSLWTGISGLAGSQQALDNESNNIANVNTIGFKSSRISFADQMYQNNIGKGTQVLATEKMYTQGNLKTTGVNYDVALSGDGFFSVSNTRGSGTAETFYTRAGNFRMGDSGTLQDTIGNEVQGWAVGNEPITTSSNPNVSKFTGDYTKLLSSKIIQYASSVETITAKATDYTLTAVSDEPSVLGGYGLKTKYGKISDVEELVKAYSTALQNLKSSPNSSSASAKAQISYVDLPGLTSPLSTGVLETGAVSKDGDEVYIYIDGKKISQSYISGTAYDSNGDGDYADIGDRTADADGYIKTMKAFADKISETPGLKAYVSNDDSSYTPSTSDTNVVKGVLRIESIIPGQSFIISSAGMVASKIDKPGSFDTITEADAGKGVGALESIRAALDKAITGKQTDIYTPTDLKLHATTVNNDFTYQINIYSSSLGENITVPTTALTITNATSIDDIVSAINTSSATNNLPTFVKAYNINGNLVVRTLDSNFDVEFNGQLRKTTPISEVQTVTLTGTASGVVSFLGTAVASSGSGDTAAVTAGRIAADSAAIITAWNTANPDKEISTITASGADLTITYKNTEGDVDALTASTSNGITFGTATTTVAGIAIGDVKKNTDYSGREGAGAEFLEIKTKIDQTASKGSLQLRLDTLGISDSAFGDFNVDSTGLITMTQDGAMFAVGQIAIARFITNRGLEPIGNNLLKSTLASGDPIYNLNNDKTAEVKANTLELSTADLSESLVNLMVFQRAFEANSKSITTADTILNTLIQLKR